MGTYSPTFLEIPISIDWIIMVHYFEYTADLSFSGESHDFWEFVYVVDGSVLIKADDVPHILKKGDVLFHYPNEFHTIQSYKKSCPKLIIISFFSRSKALEDFRHLQLSVTQNDSRLLIKLLEEAKLAFSTQLHTPLDDAYLTPNINAPFAGEQMVGLYLQQFLINIHRHIHPLPLYVPSSSFHLDLHLPHSQDQRVEDTIQFLIQHLTTPLQIDEICRTMGIGRSRLQQLFNAEFNCGVIEFFSRLKATAAKQLLLQKKHRITDISIELGFSSPAYFSSFFKKYFGCTPSQYQKAALDITRSLFELS